MMAVISVTRRDEALERHALGGEEVRRAIHTAGAMDHMDARQTEEIFGFTRKGTCIYSALI